MKDDVVDVKAREIHEHRSFRMTPVKMFGKRRSSLLGSKSDWDNWRANGGVREVISTLVVAVVMAGAYLYFF